MGARDRAKQDQKEGDLGAARRRLMSLHESQGYDPRLCREIGELCDQMGDLTEAGRWLLISDVESGSNLTAYASRFLESCNHDRSVVVSRLPRSFKQTHMESLPMHVRVRLEAVGIDHLPGPTRHAAPKGRERILGSLFTIGCGLLCFAGVATFLVGIGTVLEWIFD